MILYESMFMFCFMKNINFGYMMKLFYKFELERNFFTLVHDTHQWVIIIVYGPRQWVIIIDYGPRQWVIIIYYDPHQWVTIIDYGTRQWVTIVDT